jgi:hypothetical protein
MPEISEAMTSGTAIRRKRLTKIVPNGAIQSCVKSAH